MSAQVEYTSRKFRDYLTGCAGGCFSCDGQKRTGKRETKRKNFSFSVSNAREQATQGLKQA
jgi:hypothetical protein